jgi:4-alpha-glucanotransferase
MPDAVAERTCGVLLHPTSLPGPGGIGSLGDEAFAFVDFLASASQRIWQILPLGPIGKSNSPYDGSSAFAGNPLLISESWLVRHQLLSPSDLPHDATSCDHADFTLAREHKLPLLHEAFARFESSFENSILQQRFQAFHSRESSWLDDFTLFQALQDVFCGALWTDWPDNLARRDAETLALRRQDLDAEVKFHAFVQFLFDEQWRELKRYANHRGVGILGDIPIYLSLNSADIWAHQRLFELDAHGRPTVVAGVPPDYFSSTGQLWGNPCYRWPEMADSGYYWWVERFRRLLGLCDLVRVDHFRAFQAGWQVAAGAENAIHGRWVSGPGHDLFHFLTQALGRLPIIVEDLGVITADVTELRQRLGLPGMKVLQFAFGETSENPYLPHNYDENCVVYTGTHDNDTTVGWFGNLDSATRSHVLRYVDAPTAEINWAMIRLAYASIARIAIAPAQDLLGLDSEHRMNIPGKEDGNWSWRLRAGALTPEIADRLRGLAELYGRAGERPSSR